MTINGNANHTVLNVSDVGTKLLPAIANKGTAVIDTRGCSFNAVSVAVIVMHKHLGEDLISIPWSENGIPQALVVSMDAHSAWDTFVTLVSAVVAFAVAPVDVSVLNAALEDLRQRISAQQGVCLSTFSVPSCPPVSKFAH